MTTTIETTWYASLCEVEQQRVLFPAFDQALKRISRVHVLTQAGSMPRSLMILGPSGAGKSTVLAEYVRHFPFVEEPEQRRIPVLRAEIKANPTVRSVAEDILKAMGCPMAYRGTVNEKTDRVVSSLKRFGVELLMLDEVQHLLGATGRSFGSNNETEWLKTLLNLVDIPVVLSGLPYAEALLTSNEQLRRRLDGICFMVPFSIEEDQSQADFAGVVHWFDREIHAGRPIGLHEGDMLSRLFYASNGLIGYLLIDRIQIAILEVFVSRPVKRVAAAFQNRVWDGIRGGQFQPDRIESGIGDNVLSGNRSGILRGE